MKKYLTFLFAAVLMSSTVFISSCGDEGGGKTAVIPPDPIHTVSVDYSGTGDEVEKWEFFYDEDGRVESIDVYWNDEFDKEITYDYSVAGELTIDNNGNVSKYILDENGLVIKALWDPGVADEYDGFTYNADGLMTQMVEHYDGTDHLKFKHTIVGGNITHRIRYEDDGTTVREDREFLYTSGNNAGNIHQVYTVDSEWLNTGGIFGLQNKKLVASFVRHLTDDPTSTYGAAFDYDFDEDNRVIGVTKDGTSSGGAYTELFTYTYYDDEEVQ